ncbi:MAG TPA: D-alanyl-D-alanine carboxypeptidase [Candidatus Caccousia avicola]|uniref:serine-type D-Ala-D-Ala carboxypeptidase n=1 Tax=Candidatus Caccousia avicola TaxID=2840721 RepID=A0A9D1ARG3_9FIRM|nr:D-alanyl-D-alanine carboxypeptidase [Candidatus Caccousia avicola]
MKGRRIAACFLAAVVALMTFSTRVTALSAEELPAPSAVLMEASTGKVLFEKNAHEQRPCASITKVMTLLLVMEALDEGRIHLEDMVSASEHASSMGGSDIWLEPGETMSVDDLLKATVIVSANDAAVALVEYVSGSEEAFVQRMNERAAELGMTNTVFKNCNGLDEDGHVTTAYDIALMSRALIQHEKIFDYTQVWMDELRGGKTQLVNTNKLLKSYSGITGLKTGTTGKAGSCMAATAERDGMSLVAVVLGCASTEDRFSSAASLLDAGFSGWALTAPSLSSDALAPIAVEKGMQSTAAVEADPLTGVVVPKGREGEVVCEIKMEEILTAPVEQGQAVGEVTCVLDGEVLARSQIRAASSVEALTFSSAWLSLLRAVVSF